MFDSLLGFRNEEERNEFLIALPVLAIFGCMMYYFVFGGDQWLKARLDGSSAVAQSTGLAGGLTSGLAGDMDMDGIADTDDDCREEAGTLEHNGCPDDKSEKETPSELQSDVPADKHPQPSGLAEPANQAIGKNDNTSVANEILEEVQLIPETDIDGDSIADSFDKCPKLAGSVETQGCPAPTDSDADGVADSLDKCPQSAGTASNNGCPADSDSDGLPDYEDICPDLAGTLAEQGCPSTDTDADTVPDYRDNCPTLAGAWNYAGCPADEDRDGIPDATDQCPTEFGLLANNGCAEAPADSDVDATDTAVVVDNNESTEPESKQDTNNDEATNTDSTSNLEGLSSSITFESSSAVLTEESRQLLKAVVTVMQKYTSVKLHVDGYTDSQGDAAINKQLSAQRARACTSYIANAGIDPKRLSYRGLGESSPIADNSTAEGRKLNRRVEFILSN